MSRKSRILCCVEVFVQLQTQKFRISPSRVPNYIEVTAPFESSPVDDDNTNISGQQPQMSRDRFPKGKEIQCVRSNKKLDSRTVCLCLNLVKTKPLDSVRALVHQTSLNLVCKSNPFKRKSENSHLQ